MTRNIRQIPAIGCLVLLLLWQALPLRAQVVQPPLRHFTVHDGLAQQQVTCLFQDSRGYIWVGTKGGISKFNGRSFENFRLSDSIPGREPHAFAEDRQGNIWTLSVRGCGYYDGVKWRKVTPLPLNETGLCGDRLLAAGSTDGHIWELRPDSARAIVRTDTLQLRVGGRPAIFFMLDINTHSRLILGLDENLRLVARDTLHRGKHFLPHNNTFIAGPTYKITWPDRNGWSRMTRMGTETPFDSIRFDMPFAQTIAAGHISFVSPPGNPGDLAAYSDRRIMYVEAGSKHAQTMPLPVSMPTALLFDREGALWIGAEDGLYQYFPGGFQSVPGSVVPLPWNLVEDEDGSYYFGTFGAGLKRFFRGNVEPVKVPPAVFPCSDTELYYFGASKDRYGNLYFPHNCGLIQKKGAMFRSIFPKQMKGYKTVLHSVYDEKRNKILAGTRGKVFVYDPDTDRLDSIVFAGSERNVLSIAIDRSNNYWFSLVWKGIVRYAPETKTVTYFNAENRDMPFNGAWCMEPDPENGIWFGTTRGVFFRDDIRHTFAQVAAHAITGTVYNLKVVDSLLMIGDVSGLYVLNLNAWRRDRSEKVKAYNQFNGFSGIEPNQNCAMLDSKGNYWLLCSNQTAFIHKSKISLNDHPSRVRIYQINRQRVPYSGAAGIVLPAGENEVTVRFESIGFQQPLQTQYSWRLLGYSGDWSDWSGDDIAFFSQLPSGRYTFEVRSRHPGSISEDDVKTDRYAFEVSLPLYREPHFYRYAFFAGTILLLLGFFSLGAWRKARREAQNARQMAEERERLIKYYQVQTLQAQLNPHFIFNLLETIQHFVEEEKTADAVQQIQRLAILLRRFMESSINSDLDKIREGNREISLAAEIELLTYYIELEQIQKPGMFTFDIAVENGLEPGNCFITPMIIQPFVENAIKRGLIPKNEPPRHLSICLSRLNDAGIRCRIEDNGIGRAAAREMQARSPRKFKPRGVSLVQDRVALLAEMGIAIGIDIHDRPGGGTSVTIDFGMADNTSET